MIEMQLPGLDPSRPPIGFSLARERCLVLISALCAWEDLRLVLHNRHGTRSCAKEGTPTLKAEASETHFPHTGGCISTRHGQPPDLISLQPVNPKSGMAARSQTTLLSYLSAMTD